ncbi:virulence factor TspB C-terminal domain-related protein [Acinetobacter soli]|nr:MULTISPECIES: virulence factor TspB C-terminal domain-related protein [Acinetobacter]WEI14035.1 virulence factor TspB C-terminal domain-related protein [Acinetobacter soli]
MKRILVLILSFYIATAPVITNAGTLGGWSYSDPVSKGASAVISATKNVVINGKDFIKTGSATITPTAAQVAKTFGKTAGALALTVAIEQMLGAVDWVLDPDNNSITYTKKSSYDDASNQYYYNAYANRIDAYGSTQLEAAQNYCKSIGGSFDSWSSLNTIAFCKDPRVSVQIYRVDNPNYNPTSTTPDNQPKSLPLSTVATRVIDNAKTGEPKAQAAILQAATDILAEAETDSTKARPITNQLEESAETKPADAVDALKQNAGTAKTTNPDGTTAETEFEMPVACTWMPLVCQAASVVITKPQEWADAVVDWVAEKDVPAKSTQDINLPDTPTTPKTVNVNWGSQCPEPTTTTITFMGQSKDLQIIRYDFICEWAWVVKASVVALASIGAVFIIAGRKT